MPQQLDIFSPSSATASSTDIIGITIRLARPADPAHRRCGDLVTVGSSSGPHAAVMTCRSCGKHVGWLAANAITVINETRARFGAPEFIVLRNPSHAAGAGDEVDTHRRQR